MASMQISTREDTQIADSHELGSAESVAIARRDSSLFINSEWSQLELFLHILAVFLMAGIVVLSIRLAWLLSLK